MNGGDSPWIWLIGGPNGAGKTTLAFSILGEELGEDAFLNADVLARTLAPGAPETKAVAAGRLLIDRLAHTIAAGRTFAVETTLSGRGYLGTLAQLRAEGWQCGVIVVWLNDVDTSIARVARRVAAGGHGIETSVLRRRYGRIAANVGEYIRAADRALIFDNSGPSPILVAERDEGHLTVYVPNAPVLELIS